MESTKKCIKLLGITIDDRPRSGIFSTFESIRKIEKIKKHCQRIVVDDYGSDYDILLRKS